MKEIALGIDTTGTTSYVVLTESEQVVFRGAITSNRVIEEIIGIIDKGFKSSDLKISQLTKISVCIGPGSFTGIRTGIAIATAMADATQAKLVGVNSLFSRIALILTPATLIVPLLKAAGDEYYIGLYLVVESDQKEQEVFELTKPFVATESDLDQLIEEGKWLYPNQEIFPKLIIQSIQKVFLDKNSPLEQNLGALLIKASNYKLTKLWDCKKPESFSCNIGSNLIETVRQTREVLVPLYVKAVNAKTIVQRDGKKFNAFSC